MQRRRRMGVRSQHRIQWRGVEFSERREWEGWLHKSDHLMYGLGKNARQWRGPYFGFHKYHFAFLVVDECYIPLEVLISPWTAEFKEAKLSPQFSWRMSFCSICHKLVATLPTSFIHWQRVLDPWEGGWFADVCTMLWQEVDEQCCLRLGIPFNTTNGTWMVSSALVHGYQICDFDVGIFLCGGVYPTV